MNTRVSVSRRRAAALTARRMLASLRVQLALLLTAGLALPLIIRGAFGSQLIDGSYTLVTSIGIVASIVAAQYVVRKVTAFPGTTAVAYVVPVYTSAFAGAIAAAFAFRLDYSISLVMLSYLGTVVTAFVITLYADGGNRIFYVVPSAKVDRLREVTSVNWVPLTEAVVPPQRHIAIVADLHADLPPEWERMLADAALEGRAVYHYKQLLESLTGRVRIEHLSENSFGSLLPNLAYRKVKRLIDIGACLALLPFAALPMLAAAIAIRLEGPGPILFRQLRMGYRGRPFKVAKFRTMQVQSDTADEAERRRMAMTQANDPRITRLGRFMRKTRIDELPQILNVLAGDMSLIGPRPEAMALSTWYEAELPFYRYRHIVRPGISGWAQVNQGHVAELAEVDDKLKYDFYYIKNFSLWLDMLIVVRTARTMLSGFGAR